MKRARGQSVIDIALLSALLLVACTAQTKRSSASAVSGGSGGAVSGGSGGGVFFAGSSGQGGISGAGVSGAAGGAGVGGTGAGADSGIDGAAGTTAGSGGASGTTGMSTDAGADASAGGTPVKFCGNITTAGKVRSDFADYWDQITPENEGKWGSVEGVRNQMNWAGLDAVHDYAKQHNIPFKQHNFVWGAQQPNWISGLSQADQRAEVEEWIRLFCERYPDTQLIDVVNEPPPHTMPSYMAALGGAGTSGYDWIVQAFKWAHQYCPNAILILNDYNTIEYGNDNSHFIDIVTRIKAAGAPIDAIGAQAHAAYNVPNNTVQMYVDKLAATGLPVYISEYDIDLADDAKQRDVMESQITMFWNDDHIKGITLWGYIQGQTWLANSGLMSSSGQKRPAMTWLMGFLKR
ncbi:MAG TPA: endo-1,4-beta-xylanase [Polyangiales bacterium]